MIYLLGLFFWSIFFWNKESVIKLFPNERHQLYYLIAPILSWSPKPTSKSKFFITVHRKDGFPTPPKIFEGRRAICWPRRSFTAWTERAIYRSELRLHNIALPNDVCTAYLGKYSWCSKRNIPCMLGLLTFWGFLYLPFQHGSYKNENFSSLNYVLDSLASINFHLSITEWHVRMKKRS